MVDSSWTLDGVILVIGMSPLFFHLISTIEKHDEGMRVNAEKLGIS